jgi:hypothetical protein
LAEVSRQVKNHLGFDFRAVRHNSPLWTAIKDGINGYALHSGLRSMHSFLKVDGDFETYHASPGQIRSNLPRGRKKLEARGKVSVEFQNGSSSAEELL